MGGDNGVVGSHEATKTGYGELEGFFGGGRAAGSAIGVYYNDFSGNKSSILTMLGVLMAA